MKWDAYLVALVIVLNLQVFPFDSLPVMGALPNLPFCLMLFCALHFQFHLAIGAAFCAGLSMDIFAGYPFHVNTLLFMFVAALINLHRDMVFHRHPVTQAAVALGAMLAYHSLYLCVINLWYLPELPALHLWRRAPGIALYTAAVAPFFCRAASAYCRLWKIPLRPNPGTV